MLVPDCERQLKPVYTCLSCSTSMSNPLIAYKKPTAGFVLNGEGTNLNI